VILENKMQTLVDSIAAKSGITGVNGVNSGIGGGTDGDVRRELTVLQRLVTASVSALRQTDAAHGGAPAALMATPAAAKTKKTKKTASPARQTLVHTPINGARASSKAANLAVAQSSANVRKR
jgi:hypothetical protein